MSPPSWRREALFGGKGGVVVADLLGAARAGAVGPFQAVLLCTLDPGGSVGRHRQEQHPEIIVGLAGDGEVTVDRRPATLAPGEVVYLPLGSVLSIRNRSETEPLQYLIVKAEGAGAPG